MTRQVQLRVVLIVDDGVRVEDVARDLRARLRAMPSEALPGEGEDDRTVFWPASDVRRGEETRAPQRKADKQPRLAMRLEDVE